MAGDIDDPVEEGGQTESVQIISERGAAVIRTDTSIDLLAEEKRVELRIREADAESQRRNAEEESLSSRKRTEADEEHRRREAAEEATFKRRREIWVLIVVGIAVFLLLGTGLSMIIAFRDNERLVGVGQGFVISAFSALAGYGLGSKAKQND